MKNLLIIVFSAILLCSCISQKVKDSSKILDESQQLFAKENLKFYTQVKTVVEKSIEREIIVLRANLAENIKNIEKGIDEENTKVKKNAALSSEEKALEFIKNERKLNELTSASKEKAKETIDTLIQRKENFNKSIIILTKMQKAVASGSQKLNQYIQLKRASQVVLDEVKAIFPQIKGNISEVESILQKL